MQDEQNTLDGFSMDYNPVKKDNVMFAGYNVGDKDWMGSCSLGRNCNIKIQPEFVGHEFWASCVLWHEFCHSWAYFDGEDKGHGWGFFKRIIQKPILFLAQVPCCFAYIILQLANEK